MIETLLFKTVEWWIRFAFAFATSSYRVGEDGEWDTDNALVTLTNATSSQVIGLLPYTVYSFRVVSVNSLGMSAPSRESYYMVTLREGTPLFTILFDIVQLVILHFIATTFNETLIARFLEA